MRLRNRITAALVAALALVAAARTAPARAEALGTETFAIENARIVTVTGPVIERGTVVVKDGRIAAVGASVQVPTGANRVDGSGLTVYPGMIDSATEVGLLEIPSVAATVDVAELGDINPQLMAYEGFNPNSELVRAARIAGVTTVISQPRGGTLPGQAVMADLNGATIEQMAVRKTVGQVLIFPSGVGSRSFDFSTFTVRRTSDADARKARDKKLDDLRKLLDSARAYDKARAAHAKDPSLPLMDTDTRLEALVPVVRGELPVLVTTSDERDIKTAVDFCDEQKLKMVLRAGGDPSGLIKAAPMLGQKKIPVVVGPMYSLPQREDDRYDLPQEVPLALAKAGVRFAFSTDDPAQVRDLPYHAAMAVAYGGLSKEDAVKAITIWPAEIWGVSDRLGSIEVGKYANLVVTTGDVLEPRSDVKYVFIEGRQIPLTSRQTELYERFKNRQP